MLRDQYLAPYSSAVLLEGDRIRFDRVCASPSSGDLTTAGACRVHSCRDESGSVGPFACEGPGAVAFLFIFSL